VSGRWRDATLVRLFRGSITYPAGRSLWSRLRDGCGLDRTGLLALLIANLCFAKLWTELADYSSADSFFFFAPPPRTAYLAVWINILLWSAGTWGLLHWLRKRQSPRMSAIAFWVGLLLVLNAVREVLGTHFAIFRAGLLSAVGMRGAEILIGVSLMLLIVAVWRFAARLRALAVSVLFLTSPLVAFQFAAMTWRLMRPADGLYTDQAPAPFLKQVPGTPRVVWIIFDEMDYRLSFPERPGSLCMPAFDGFSRESVQLSNALSPADATSASVPALLHGSKAREFQPTDPRTAEVFYEDSVRAEVWNSNQTIFATARRMNLNSAVICWYLPYCRVLDDLSVCEWTPMSRGMNSTGSGFGEILVNQNRRPFETSLLSPFGQSLTVKEHVRSIESSVQHARRAVSDERLGLVFLHFPVPHAPAVYDRFRQTMTKSNSPISGYIDSLALADRVLGQLRGEMEQCGSWDKTTVLVTADHSFRASAALDGKNDPRVPYVLKLAGQSRGARYDRVFHTVRTRALLEAILSGRLRSPEQVIGWMGQGS
jgi:hypothetical protein